MLGEPFLDRAAAFYLSAPHPRGPALELLEAARAELDAMRLRARADGDRSQADVARGKAELHQICLWIGSATDDLAAKSKILHFCRDELSFALLPGEGAFQFTSDWFTDNVPAWKEDLAHFEGAPSLRFLEVGVFEGRATCWLLENVLRHEGSTIACVDTFALYGQQTERFDHNVAVVRGQGKVTKLVGASEAVLRTLSPESYDFIYIDADHQAVSALRDGLAAWPLLKVGGLMTFDDYEWDRRYLSDAYREHPGLALLMPRRGIDAVLALYAGHFEVVRRGYQVTVRKTRHCRPAKVLG